MCHKNSKILKDHMTRKKLMQYVPHGHLKIWGQNQHQVIFLEDEILCNFIFLIRKAISYKGISITGLDYLNKFDTVLHKIFLTKSITYI